MEYIKKCWLLFFLLIGFGTKARTQPIDSVCIHWQDSSKQIFYPKKYLFEYEALIHTDTNRSYIMHQLVLRFTKYIPNPQIKAEAYRIEGVYYTKNALYDSAFYSFGKSLLLSERKADTLYKRINGNAKLNLGMLYKNQGDYSTALQLLLDAENILLHLNQPELLAKVYTDISDIYLKLSDLEKAKIYVNKALGFINLVKSPKTQAMLLLIHANMLVYDSLYAEADLFYEQARRLADEYHLPLIMINYHYNKAFSYSQQEKYLLALPHYQASEDIAIQTGNKYDACDALYKIGLMHYYLMQHHKADFYLQQALAMAHNIQSKLLIRNILDVLTYNEAEQKNYQSAYNYLQKYVDYAFDILSEENQEQNNFLSAKYQNLQKENTINQLSAEKKLSYIKLRQRKAINLALGFMSITLVLVLAALTIIYKSRRKINHQQIALQQQKIAQLEKEKQIVAMHSVLQGEEQEKQRIAKDLHDGLGGLLSGVKLSLTNYREHVMINETEAEQFHHALGLLDNSIGELRRVAHSMMPQALIKFGLAEALQDYCDAFKNNGKFTIVFQNFGPGIRQPQNIEIAIYRICQELINNAIKHANCTEILIQLVNELSRIHLTVQDNGHGFNTDNLSSQTGQGLHNIRNRIYALNGKLEISSNPQNGTEISCEFEIKNQYGKNINS